MIEAAQYENLDTNDAINVLVVDGGMRGEALKWILGQGERAGVIDTTPFDSQRPDAEVKRIGQLANSSYDMLLVGQEDAQHAGIVDHASIPACGLISEQSRLESSKSFMKELAMQLGEPTAPYKVFPNSTQGRLKGHSFIDELGDLGVVKDDFLAQGKAASVFTSNTDGHVLFNDMLAGKFSNRGQDVIVEGYSKGPEWSGCASISGQTIDIWPAAEDHKQLSNNDEGLITGGMGVITPLDWLDATAAKTRTEETVRRFLPLFDNVKGFWFPGYKGNDCLEINGRIGSPEGEAHVRNIDTDFLEHVIGIIKGTLDQHRLTWKDGYAVSVVGAAEGYPEPDKIKRGELITGLENAREVDEVEIFLGSVAKQGDEIYSNGGRLFAVTARGQAKAQALGRAITAMNLIRVGGRPPVFRSDIGLRTS